MSPSEWAPRLPALGRQHWLAGRVIDVVVWGASRPALFERTIEAFQQHAKFKTGRLRFFLEDGCFDEEKAGAAAEIARARGFDGINVEPVGSYGWAMTNAIGRWVRAPLMFSLEDDMMALREIDLDLAFDAFTQNPCINQLFYNRRKNAASQNDGGFVFAKRHLVVNGKRYPVLGSAHWYFGPSLWRMGYVWPRWSGAKDNIHFHINSADGFLPPGEKGGPRPAPEWYADVLGAVTWGGVGEPAMFQHIGHDESVHKRQGRV